MSSPIGWAIIGTGRIAKRFATALQRAPDARLVAIASRRPEQAAGFATAHGAAGARICADPAEAAACPGVDAVYVATPHPMHHAGALAAIAAGRAVLVEKPITINAIQAGEVIDAARARGTFLMEAMWTRCLPATRQARTWLAEGRIGDPHLVFANFGFASAVDIANHQFDPALAGGALLDLGVYPLAWAQMVFGGAPQRVVGSTHIGSTGVDERSSISLAFAGGGLAALACSLTTNLDHTARIEGSRGRIVVLGYYATRAARLEIPGAEPVLFDEANPREGFDHQLAEVHRCLRAGIQESPCMPWADTLSVARMMDELRRQWGIRYPGE